MVLLILVVENEEYYPVISVSLTLTCLESPSSVAARAESEDWALHQTWSSSPPCLYQSDPGNSGCLCSTHREVSVPT